MKKISLNTLFYLLFSSSMVVQADVPDYYEVFCPEYEKTDL